MHVQVHVYSPPAKGGPLPLLRSRPPSWSNSTRRRSISRVLSDDAQPSAPSGRSFLSEYGRPYPPAAYPRRLDRGGPPLAAYLALLQLGFTVPPSLPKTRWALTPPFHPCLIPPVTRRAIGGLFSVALILHVAATHVS